MEYHNQFKRLEKAISSILEPEKATELQNNYPLAKTANNKEKFKWAKNVCEYLDNNFDKKTVRTIRENCMCQNGVSYSKKLALYLSKVKSIKEFVEYFNQNEKFGMLEYVSENNIQFIYPKCYCSCVKYENDILPISWCYCTLGYLNKVFTFVMNKTVSTELLSSIKTGGDCCKIDIKW